MSIYSRDEIEGILKRYGDMIYRMAYIQVKNRDVADDIYQEVCMRLVRQKTRIEPEEHLKAWLLRITINCCKDYWKSSWVQRITWCQTDDANAEEEATFEQTDMSENQSMGYVTECVQRLSQKYRVVIHLYYYEDYSQKEIARLLGKKESTIASWLRRGREQLKTILNEREAYMYEF